MSLRSPLVLVACCLASLVARADDWSRAAEADGVTVDTRKTEDGIREMRTVGEVDAPPDVILRVLLDVDAYAATMPYVEKATKISSDGVSVVLYVVMKAPFSARRDYGIRLTPSREPDGTLRLDWAAANELAPASEYVRITTNTGHWRLVALDGGRRTRAEQFVHADPAGMLPRWLVSRAASKAAPSVYVHLREAVQQPKYAAEPTAAKAP